MSRIVRLNMLSAMVALASDIAQHNAAASPANQITDEDVRGIFDVAVRPSEIPVPTAPLPDGIGEQREDGAVRLPGWDRFCAEGVDDDPLKKAWLADPDTKHWHFIPEAALRPDLPYETRFAISTNCSNAQMFVARFGYVAGWSDEEKAATTHAAFHVTSRAGGTSWVLGEPIADAQAFGQPVTSADGATHFPGPSAARAYRYAQLNFQRWKQWQGTGAPTPGFGRG